MQAWTTYRILLPVTYLTSSHEEKYHTNTPTPLFDPSFLPDRPSEYEQIYLTPSPDFLKTGACLGAVSQFERKSQLTRAIREWLVTQIPARNRVVFTLDLRLLDTSDLEAFSKGIFYYLAYRDGMEQLYLLLRLVFRDELALCEFLRRASIFYSRSGQNQWLSKVQMAFCVPKDKNLPVSEQSALESDIWVILAGSNLNTAYATAMLFSHYNLRGFETLLPQIRYFVRSPESKLTSQIQAQPQFPFDLVRDSSGQSQFLRHMTICLERDLQEEPFGCKIQNAHLRLGSKIHITDFFEAELLFYSIGNTYRFAYLIAEELISELLAVDDESRCKELILVGYESYSSILVSQVAELVSLSLKQKGKAPPHIIHMQYLREDDGTEHISLINGEITDPQCENTACAFILPIGTTLSTIYKIRNVLFRQFADQLTVNLIKMLQSYAVIVVGDRSEDQLSKSYWSRSSYNPATIELTAESEASSPIIVHNFMALQTTWYLPTQCPLCGNAADGHPTNWAHPSAHIPLIQTDKTSTLPNLIFPLYREGIRGISFLLDPQTSETNRQQLTNLKGHIQYGHIFEGSNHFQFYIDYIGFYAKEQGKCQRWLADLRHRIDANAFNIIVSPRSRNDCLFLKDVVDIVFQHNLRLLFLPLETVFREDIRARFSYITTEYLAACESDRKPKINIYYVDYTLVSGAMLQRGKSLVNMLLSEVAAPNVSNISLFQKVILLINRSSYDTINSIIPDPDQNFMAYATLAVSTFNTHQGRCPSQNPLSDLFRFLDRERDISMSVLSGMLGFYRLAKEMENGTLLELQKNYIAQYDKLCFYFNQIAGSQSCCLIHQQNGNNQIIAQSLWKDNLETHDQIHVVLRDVESRLSRSYLHNTVIPWRPSKACQGNYHSALVLTLRIQRRQDVFQQQNIYIVLLFQDDPQSSGMTNNISRGRYVLFMRQPLQQLLERDLYALHHFRITYQDVFPLSKSGSPTAHDEERDKAHDEKRIKECMTLLHLTDLHITAQSKEQILKLIGEQAAELKKGNPDLLLITGDAVQSNSTAIDLERNYQAAREVIQALAVLLWPNTSEDGGDAVRPRPDWRKRIVIIPGNHDYATMNELSATHILRTTSGGTPVLKDGSPMSRYSYYIQFLQELLQVDMSVSIRNGLNQIREYSELCIRVIALNSVAEVGPLRNNKVQLDEAYIERQPDVVPDANGYFNICMAHHTVYYRPDYVADRYYEKEMNPRIISQLKEIIRVCADGQQKMVDLPSDRDRIKVETQERLDLLLNQTSYQILGKYHKGSALYSDIEYLKEHWSILTNERCQQIISDFSLHEAMSARDYGAYTERLTKLAKKYPIHIMLGGHTHQAGQTSDSFCFHGPRFYYGEKYPTLYFGRLILKRGEELPWIPDHYEFFPDNQLKETLKSDQPPINIFTQPK